MGDMASEKGRRKAQALTPGGGTTSRAIVAAMDSTPDTIRPMAVTMDLSGAHSVAAYHQANLQV